MTRPLLRAMLSSLLLGVAATSGAQEYPSKMMRLIVPTAPGAAAQDVLGRLLAPEISKIARQNVIVENRAGVGGLIAYEYVGRQAPADGHAFVVVTVPTLAALPVTVKDLRFNPLEDLPPAIELVESRVAMVATAKADWKSFRDFVAHARANPGKLNFGSAGHSTRMLGEAIFGDMGLSLVSVPFPSGAPYYLALAAGDVHVGLIAASSGASLGDKVRLLAITGERRASWLPDLPTFQEMGLTVLGQSFSINIRNGTPKPVVDRLYAIAAQALEQPGVKFTLDTLQMDIVARRPEVALKSLLDQARSYAAIAKKAGIEPQ